jgi:small subunit ribosomal protein S8
MNSTDPIADMLTRIRNAIAVRNDTVDLPHSKAKQAVAEVLKANNYIVGVDVKSGAIGKTMYLKLHGIDENARITDIKRLSSPGRRQYVSADKIPTIKQGRGMVILSTSSGVMAGNEAKAKNVGGELICEVY